MYRSFVLRPHAGRATQPRISSPAVRGARRLQGAGLLIAAAVADGASGIGDHDEALVHWLSDAEPQDPAWAEACAAARELATSRRRQGRA